jgi:PAS domain S-box-containing protein
MGAPPEGLSDAVLEAARAAGIGISVSVVREDGVENLWISPRAAEILGRTQQELLARSAFDFIAPEERARLQEQRERRSRGEATLSTFETVVVTADDRRVPISVALSQLTRDGRRLTVAFVTDITEQKRAAAAVLASESRLRSVVEGAPDGVAISRNGTLLWVNKAASRLLGVDPPEALIGRSLGEFLDPEGLATMRERIMRQAATGRQEPPVEYRARRPDGTIAIAEIASLPIEWEGAPAVIAFARDVTDRAALQAQLARAERLAAVGTLAAGVAHEINNPLTFVTLGLDALERNIAKGAPVDQLIQEIRQGTSRVAAIVRELRAFSQSDDDLRGAIDIRAVLASAERLVAHQLRGRAQLVRQLGDTPRVLGNSNRLEQVFVNLLVNAVQALPEGRAENRIEVTTETSLTGAIVVEVRDNGDGISSDILSRVFDPFFTTKAPGVGTGLGLSICHRIVTQLGGSIGIESVRGEGTSVRVSLPAADDDALPIADVAESRPSAARKRVLILDDERALVMTLQCLLERDHDVIATTDARDALTRLLEEPVYDLILCDLAMPGLDGVELFERAITKRPELRHRFVFMTGGAFTPKTSAFLEGRDRRCIQKPFRIGEIEDILRATT